MQAEGEGRGSFVEWEFGMSGVAMRVKMFVFLIIVYSIQIFVITF